jgi:hypothetical protein
MHIFGAMAIVRPHPQDENLRRIQEVGRKARQQESGYHQWSLAETTMFRFKAIFRAQLRSRRLSQQISEASIKCAALNWMTYLGMPDSYLIA